MPGWSLLVVSLLVFAGNTGLRDLEGGAPRRRQHGGLEPAGELAEARQPGPRGGRRQRRVVRGVQGHQGADRQRHQAAQRPLRPDRRRRRPDRDRHRDLGAAGQERRAGDRQRTGRARPGRQRRQLHPARAAAAGAAGRSGARDVGQRFAVRRRSTSPCAKSCWPRPWPAASPKSAPAAPAPRWPATRWRATPACSRRCSTACARATPRSTCSALGNAGRAGRAGPGQHAVGRR